LKTDHSNEELTFAQSQPQSSIDNEISNQLNELKLKYEQSELNCENLKEQLSQSNNKLNEITNLYELTKQHELDEKNKNKHLERSIRALKIEKDQLFAVIIT
jgi:hypothetical protein